MLFALRLSVIASGMLIQERPNKLRHVVLLAFSTLATASDIQAVETAFAKLETQIEEIVALEWGTNVSPEGHARGFTHCFFLTFESEADRDAYLVHPEHVTFGALLKPHLDKVCVLDYWTT